jgi:predicted nucleic acid-binding protein
MFYVDTSVIVAYYCPEPLSEKAEAFITTHTRPAISLLTELELFSAISKKIREGSMDRKDGSRIIAKFLSHLDDLFYTRLPIEPHHYRLARDWIGQFTISLRSLDAIHLAIASSEGATLITADEGLAKSAESLAVDIVLLSID